VAAQGAGALHASAELRNVGGDAVGWAAFTEDAGGILHINVHVKGLAPGLHGIHIHNNADCTPPFSAAGSHHNPLGSTHGDHAGDFPNLVVNRAGIGHLDTTSHHATLSAGLVSVFDTNGSALIIHAGEDDLTTDPTGNSGGRIACGIIVAG
jgi:Cu-Zn family superoxide dismutase